MSKIVVEVLLILVFAAVALSAYFALAYPRTVVSFPVAFTIGADVERREFTVPVFHDSVQVEVTVTGGSMIWTAQILNDGDVFWNDTRHQADSTTYRSDWTRLPSGTYNFTFATAGIGSLDALITVTCKGGVW
jgi:hypothetical protein